MSIDYQLFQLINSLAGKSDLFDNFAVFLASHLIYVMISAVILSVWYDKRIFWASLGGAGLAYLFNYLVGKIYFRPRPFVSHEVVQLIEAPWSLKSFPSDHATVSFALATAVFMFDRRLGVLAFIMAALISLGRVMVGVHYPLDVLAGAVFGIAFSWTVARQMAKDKR